MRFSTKMSKISMFHFSIVLFSFPLLPYLPNPSPFHFIFPWAGTSKRTSTTFTSSSWTSVHFLFPSLYNIKLLWLSKQVLSHKINGAELSYRQSRATLGTAGCVEPPFSLLPKANSTFLHTLKQTGNHLSPWYKSNLSSKVNVFPTNNALHVWSTLKPQYL